MSFPLTLPAALLPTRWPMWLLRTASTSFQILRIFESFDFNPILISSLSIIGQALRMTLITVRLLNLSTLKQTFNKQTLFKETKSYVEEERNKNLFLMGFLAVFNGENDRVGGGD